MAANQKDMLSGMGGFKELTNKMEQVYGLFTNDPERRRKINRDHHERGALRSSQGTPDQEHKNRKMFEEKERLEKMYESGEKPTDIPTSNKLYEMWLEKQADRPGIRQDDKYDLIPHETLQLNAEDIVSSEDIDITFDRPVRMLKSTINGDEAVINRLVEPYPTECFNHGKLAKQTQKYYMCKSLKPSSNSKLVVNEDQQPFRVTGETYNYLLSNYSD